MEHWWITGIVDNPFYDHKHAQIDESSRHYYTIKGIGIKIQYRQYRQDLRSINEYY